MANFGNGGSGGIQSGCPAGGSGGRSTGVFVTPGDGGSGCKGVT